MAGPEATASPPRAAGGQLGSGLGRLTPMASDLATTPASGAGRPGTATRTFQLRHLRFTRITESVMGQGKPAAGRVNEGGSNATR